MCMISLTSATKLMTILLCIMLMTSKICAVNIPLPCCWSVLTTVIKVCINYGVKFPGLSYDNYQSFY